MGGSKKTTYKKKLPMNLQMNTYELNKIVYAKLPVLTQASPERGAALQILAKYIQDHNNQYFMFLNNDVHYYTIFNMQDAFEESFYGALDDCMRAIGDLISIELNEQGYKQDNRKENENKKLQSSIKQNKNPPGL